MTGVTLAKSCNRCQKDFIKPVNCSLKKWQTRDFCSKHCANSRIKKEPEAPLANIEHGLNGYNLYGCKCDICREAMRQRKRLQRAGISVPKELWGHKEETNPAWRGDDVGYKNIHDWVRRHKAKTGKCSHCNGDFGTNSGHATHWANIDHTYRRNLDDYIELCPPCHKTYDLLHNHGERAKFKP
jgi:hypothetical protein